MRKLIVTAAASGLLFAGAQFVPASADSACKVGGPAGAYDGGAQVCVRTGTVNGTVTVTPSYAAADGEAGNPEPVDGYVGVDSTGVSACASGEYNPGGGNNPVVDPSNPVDLTGPCAPQFTF